MLKHIGEVNSASSIEKALSGVLKEGKFLTHGILEVRQILPNLCIV
jgi:isocitrate/isopropylmalate dehydrogenase